MVIFFFLMLISLLYCGLIMNIFIRLQLYLDLINDDEKKDFDYQNKQKRVKEKLINPQSLSLSIIAIKLLINNKLDDIDDCVN